MECFVVRDGLVERSLWKVGVLLDWIERRVGRNFVFMVLVYWRDVW